MGPDHPRALAAPLVLIAVETTRCHKITARHDWQAGSLMSPYPSAWLFVPDLGAHRVADVLGEHPIR